MKRYAPSELIRKGRAYRKVLHKCWHCGAVGVKPGILATANDNYGVRLLLADARELAIDQSGVCEPCAELLRSKLPSSGLE